MDKLCFKHELLLTQGMNMPVPSSLNCHAMLSMSQSNRTLKRKWQHRVPLHLHQSQDTRGMKIFQNLITLVTRISEYIVPLFLTTDLRSAMDVANRLVPVLQLLASLGNVFDELVGSLGNLKRRHYTEGNGLVRTV